MALWGSATVTAARDISGRAQLRDVSSSLLVPADDFLTAVQAERGAATRYLAHPDTRRQAALRATWTRTDTAAAALRRGAAAGDADATALEPRLPDRVRSLLDDAAELPRLRADMTGGDGGKRDSRDTRSSGDARASGDSRDKEDWFRAYTAYTEVADHALSIGGALTDVQGPDEASSLRVVQELARAREEIAREDALLGAAEATGQMSRDQQAEFTGAVHTQRQLLDSGVRDLRPADAATYRSVTDGTAYRGLRGAEDAVIRAGSRTAAANAAPAARWSENSAAVLGGLQRAQTAAGTGAIGRADVLGPSLLNGSGAAVVLGLAAVLVSLLILVRIGRGHIVELVDLRNSALRLAGQELPRAMDRLRAGESIDVDKAAPVRDHGDDEVGQINSALGAVHRAALQAAAERAEMLGGISRAYVQLARRSQVLLHRQLSLLDTMERRNEDPVELEDLFRLDHLTTRMRRHAESLIILSGAAPGRAWRRPVPLLDVVRAAVSEVEDFARVDVQNVPGVRLVGGAVTDLVHLLAELAENATAFSPPHTRVQVRAERVGTGAVVEIADRGLGMGADALAEANRRISDTTRVDLLDTEQLGLFVVNRLAHRQHVQVSLQPSPYGGVTAVVLIPEVLLDMTGLDDEPDGSAEPARPARPVRPARPARLSGPPRPVRLVDGAERGEITAPRTASAAPAVPPAPASAPAALPAAPAAPTPQVPPGAPASTPAMASTPAQSPALAQSPAPSRDGVPDGVDPLPRRVRQASLAPELRTTPRPRTPAPPNSAPTASRHSPEALRATMTALRAGWVRGRDEADPAHHPAHQPAHHPANETPTVGEDS
ncbi:nitrate- and nitrite sensing domain-containing protein [Streptomyces sp. NPDC048297]|uniref:sensor histidine kinase n=1 Tax=Streptomyces sp. NPDC048297 TaxID=3365531 RepID=UPI0037236206